MRTFRDLLRLVATNPGEYRFRFNATDCSIVSSTDRPNGLIFCDRKPILRFRFSGDKAEFRLPGWFTPWSRFNLDESLDKLGPAFYVGVVDMLTVAIDHSPSQPSSEENPDE